MQTYLFYDLETSGISPVFDQVYQFAAIRTDLELNEIARYEFLVKPTCDVIPDPGASVIHRLSLNTLQKEGIPEHEAIFKIHALLNTPGTISLGYNTLSFDDEFLRFNFYRHLLTPYTHQFANQCRRMDLFPMVVFYYLGRREHLAWGMRDEKISLKLEDLSAKNQLSSGPAHNAMVDVEATVNLAKKLKQDTKMWENLIGCFLKPEDSARLAKLPLIDIAGVGYPHGIAVNAKFGFNQNYQVPVLGLGQHWHYLNQTLWLKLDDERLFAKEAALIPELWTLKKRPAEPPFIIQPSSRFNLMDADRTQLETEALIFLQQNPDYFKAIQAYALDFKFPVHAEADIDSKLYQMPFWTNEETAQMHHFWQARACDKSKCAAQFRNAHLVSLAERHLGRFYRESLHAAGEKAFTDYLDQIWQPKTPQTGHQEIVDYQLKPKLTRAAALQKALDLNLTSLDGQQKEVLAEVIAYLQLRSGQQKPESAV